MSPLKREMTDSGAPWLTCLAVFMLAKAAHVCWIIKNLSVFVSGSWHRASKIGISQMIRVSFFKKIN